MGKLEQGFSEGDPVGPLVKEITQEAINLFEGSAGHSEPSQFTDEEAARETLGTSGTVASGRMSISFALELLRRHFGSESSITAAWLTYASSGLCAPETP